MAVFVFKEHIVAETTLSASQVQFAKLARNTGVEVAVVPETDDDPIEWVRVNGLNSFNPGMEETFQDTTAFENDGAGSQDKTGYTWAPVLGLIQRANADGDMDPGQKILADTAGKLGPGSKIFYRQWERDGGPECYEGIVSPQWTPSEGDPNAVRNISVTLHGDGPRHKIDNPYPAGTNGDDEGGSGE